MPEKMVLIIGGFVGIWFLLFVYMLLCYRKPAQGQALIRSGFGGNFVSFSGKIVMPLLHRAELLDITLKRLVIDQQGSEALICKDGMQVDIKAAFFVRINPTPPDVLKVVQALGVEGAANIEILTDLFKARFLISLQTVAKENTYEQLSDRETFKKQVIQTVDNDLDGYRLDTVTIDYFEKTKTA